MKIAIALSLLGLALYGQTPASRGNPFTSSRTWPFGATQSVRVMVNGLPAFSCNAASDIGLSSPMVISSASNTDPVVLTIPGHQFDYQGQTTAQPLVRIQGFTGAWAGANGVWAATPTSADTLTIPFNAVSANAMSGIPLLTTRSPRKSDAVWAIQKNVFDPDGNGIWTGYAVQASGAGNTTLPSSASVRYGLQCLNLTTRTDYAYQ